MAKFVAGGNLGLDNGSDGTVEVSTTYTAPSGHDDTCLVTVVDIRYFSQVDDPILSGELTCKYDGVDMTLAANIVDNTSGHGTYIFYKLNPSKTSKTVIAQFSTGTSLQLNDFLELNYILLSEVDQTNPLGAASAQTGAGNPLTVSLATDRKNGICVGGATMFDASADNQTNVYSGNPATGIYTYTSYLKFIDTGSKVFSYDNAAASYSAMSAVVFRDSGGFLPGSQVI